jgi:hypothetical protein
MAKASFAASRYFPKVISVRASSRRAASRRDLSYIEPLLVATLRIQRSMRTDITLGGARSRPGRRARA